MNEKEDILSSLKIMMDELKTDLKKEVQVLSNRIDVLTDKVDTAVSDTTKIKLSLENNVKKDINLLAKGFGTVVVHSNKINQLAENMEIVKFRCRYY